MKLKIKDIKEKPWNKIKAGKKITIENKWIHLLSKTKMITSPLKFKKVS